MVATVTGTVDISVNMRRMKKTTMKRIWVLQVSAHFPDNADVSWPSGPASMHEQLLYAWEKNIKCIYKQGIKSSKNAILLPSNYGITVLD